MIFLMALKLGWDDILRSLSLKIAAQIPAVPPEQFNFLWLPFLHRITSIFLEQSVPLSTPRYQQLALAIVESYLDRYVGPESHPGENDWAMPDIKRSLYYACRCNDCEVLMAFLKSSTLRTKKFQCGKDRRRHLHDILDSYGSAVSHETDQSTNPNTLVVIKRSSGAQDARRAWESRRNVATTELGKLKQSELVELLGEEDYKKIVKRLPGLALSDSALRASSGNSVAGVKRKAEDELTDRDRLADFLSGRVEW
jgi:hypothetical protein